MYTSVFFFRRVCCLWHCIYDVLGFGIVMNLDCWSFMRLSDPNVKLTLSFSRTEIQFLDTKGFFEVKDRSGTDLFIKSTDRNNILLYSSKHPRKMVESLPWSQMITVCKIVSQEKTVYARLDKMSEKFIQGGYSKSLEREKLFAKRVRRLTSERIAFVSTNGPESGPCTEKTLAIITEGLPSDKLIQSSPFNVIQVWQEPGRQTG